MRFQSGETAILAVARSERGLPHVYKKVVVKFWSEQDGFYAIETLDGTKIGNAYDWQLRKLEPAHEPINMIKHQESAT